MALKLPSFRLYRRIFLQLLGAQVLIAVGAVIATVVISNAVSPAPSDWSHLAREAGEAFRTGGAHAFDDWQKKQFQEGKVTFLIGPDGKSADGLDLPPHLEHWLRLSPTDRMISREGPPGRGADVILPLEAPQGYRLLVINERGPFSEFPFLYRAGAAAAVAIFLIAIVTLFLTRSLVSPIIDLRRVTHSVAAGEYSKRVGNAALARDDEIGELAADFDAMAERIQDQFQNQRQLFRDVSHELKSPLARLQLAIELLRAEADPQQERWLDRLDKEAHALSTMIDRILMLAQVDPSAVDIRRGRVDIEALLSSLIDDARFEAGKKGQKIIYEGPAEAPIVGGSQVHLASAIENVIRNAIIYGTPETDLRIALEPGNENVRITVENLGESLRSSDLRRIFEPFYRAPGGRVGPTTGQGIGLAITRNVIHAHRGTVEARNHPDGGLIMHIVLPTSGALPED
ncbi:HAMP domain-containing histidine kinase [Nisaea acidiphila]|uniref:histidine kinase n=1 Tax=Nisaea acidiphila TaxID=1862145 RepID=A0A9J7ATY5_9PROT|nr:HAMP domain-containing sensor histidine kinase [Nisaea acidiphila]UUX49953.1 HAMP domain-containing histidine kinase [Nisaea acidiphila]